MKNSTPILKYPGAKWRLSTWIVSHFPTHESYLEPFFGSGAVFFNKSPARIETINDIDGEIVHFFKICRNRPDDLAHALHLTPWSREERDAAYEPALDEIERARRFAVRCWMTFGASPKVSKNRKELLYAKKKQARPHTTKCVCNWNKTRLKRLAGAKGWRNPALAHPNSKA